MHYTCKNMEHLNPHTCNRPNEAGLFINVFFSSTKSLKNTMKQEGGHIRNIKLYKEYAIRPYKEYASFLRPTYVHVCQTHSHTLLHTHPHTPITFLPRCGNPLTIPIKLTFDAAICKQKGDRPDYATTSCTSTSCDNWFGNMTTNDAFCSDTRNATCH